MANEKNKENNANATKSGACRFCGQQVIIKDGAGMTEPQLEEAATMNCDCDDAKAYQEAANRRKTAKERVQNLFGAGAGNFTQPEETLQCINAAVDLVCAKRVKQVALTITTGLKCRIALMAKDKIKITREISNIDAFEQ